MPLPTLIFVAIRLNGYSIRHFSTSIRLPHKYRQHSSKLYRIAIHKKKLNLNKKSIKFSELKETQSEFDALKQIFTRF